MRKVTWRNLVARKLRLLLSAFAIVLGVAFVAGSLVFTDTMAKSFDNIVAGTVPGVMVSPKGAFSGDIESSLNVDSRTLDAALVDDIAQLPGIDRADGSVDGQGLYVLRADGRLLGGQGPPTLAFNYSDAPNAAGEQIIEFIEGRQPENSGEVVLDRRAAEQADYSIGDTVTMASPGSPPRIEAELVGIVELNGGGTAGATIVMFDTKTAQDIFLEGRSVFTSISVTPAEGVTQEQAADTIREILPPDVDAVTGQKIADDSKELISTILGYLNIFLLVFAAIALVVGTFLIVNTFSILVAQRSRELALLRAMGASRGQVTRSVLTEAFVIGLVGSTVGLALGFALAAALKALFSNFGLDLSSTSLVFAPGTVIASYAVGIIVTMIAAWLPARRAAKIPPVAAMRDEVAMPEGSVRKRAIFGIVFAIVGAILMVAGLFFDISRPALWVGLGIFAILMAVAMLSPILAIPVIGAAGVVFRRLFGSIGHLAAENARRNPRRTAATASALMIGLALVTTMSILGSSVNKSIEVAVDEQFTSDFLISTPGSQGFSPAITELVRDVDGIERLADSQTLFLNAAGNNVVVTSAVDLGEWGEIYDIDWISGEKPSTSDQIALSQSKAKNLGVDTGDVVALSTNAGERDFTVTGVYGDAETVADASVTFEAVETLGIKRADSILAVNIAPGENLKTVGDRIEEALTDFPMITVQNKEDFTEAQRSQVSVILNLIYALLGLAIVIAVLGIINTLALSVIERTREIGLLRAVGVTRRQLRRMVRLESVSIALLGAVLGIGAGLLFGTALCYSFRDDGITDIAIPFVQLLVFVIVSAIVGVLAAVFPARRAAKMDVLQAISTD